MLSMEIKSSGKREKGFTLIEVLISLFIFSMMVIAVSKLTYHNALSAQRLDYLNQAISLGNDKMEQLKKLAQNEPYNPNAKGFDWFISKGNNFHSQGYPGYLSASAGASVTTEALAPLFDDGATRGDVNANNELFTGEDWVNLDYETFIPPLPQVSTLETSLTATKGRVIQRLWTIEPVPNDLTTLEFDAYNQDTGGVDNNNGLCSVEVVKATVVVSWTDMQRKKHDFVIQAFIPRREAL